MGKRVIIIETETYKNSLIKLKNPETIRAVEKKVKKLLDNPSLAVPMSHQHSGICEIKVGSSHRVYCMKKERAIILFLLGPAIHHKKNYKKSKEYQKIFREIKELESKYGEAFIKRVEKDLNKSISQ